MPAVLCPYCTRPTTLPDPWTAPGFTCPHCHATVALATPPPPPAPADPFELGDAPARARRPRHARAEVGHGTSAFLTMFGGSIGCSLGCLVAFVGVAGLLVLLASQSHRTTTTTEPEPVEKKAKAATPAMTKAKYDAVAAGMSYRKVVEVVGFPGEEIASVEVGRVRVVTYTWLGPAGSLGANMSATFEDGVMASKSQIGLR